MKEGAILGLSSAFESRLDLFEEKTKRDVVVQVTEVVEDEPLQSLGEVQGYGCLAVLRKETDGRVVVKAASDNCIRVIGHNSYDLLELESFCDILSEEQGSSLLDNLESVQEQDTESTMSCLPDAFALSFRLPGGCEFKCWGAMHLSRQNRDLILCEFERISDQVFLPTHLQLERVPGQTSSSYRKLLKECHGRMSVAGRSPRRYRTVAKDGSAAAMDVLRMMSSVQQRLAGTNSLDSLSKILVGMIRQLTGFHNVKLSQLGRAFNRTETDFLDQDCVEAILHPYGLSSSVISAPGELGVRVGLDNFCHDRDQLNAKVMGRKTAFGDTPLDLGSSYLQILETSYMREHERTSTRSSLLIGIYALHQLWGFISCQEYGRDGRHLSFPLRRMCQQVCRSASLNVNRLLCASQLQAQKDLVSTSPSRKFPMGHIVATPDELLKLVEADFGCLSIREETKIFGKSENLHEALTILEYLRFRKFTVVTNSDGIDQDFPDIRHIPDVRAIAGLLLAPLAADGSAFLVFFRKLPLPVRDTINSEIASIRLMNKQFDDEPQERDGFNGSRPVVNMQCHRWTQSQIETANIIQVLYGKFIEVWYQKDTTCGTAQASRDRALFSAGKIREPLIDIINRLQVALGGLLDADTRENLLRSYAASKSLIYVINDLLDLTKVEVCDELVEPEIINLSGTVWEATEVLMSEAKRKEVHFQVLHDYVGPVLVLGNQRRFRQCVTNIATNAIQHTSSGGAVCLKVRLEPWRSQRRTDVEITVQDSGCGMSQEKLQLLVEEINQVSLVSHDVLEEMFAPGAHSKSKGQITTQGVLGLGLAVVARLAHNMKGHVSLESERGRGTLVTLSLPFELQPEPVSDQAGTLVAGYLT